MKHVLFIDDDALTNRVIALYLKKQVVEGGLQLYFATSVADAKVVLASDEGALISDVFTDINMPEEDGFDLLMFVKREYADKKVYMITGYDLQEYQDEASALGSDGFFTKPIDIEKILMVL